MHQVLLLTFHWCKSWSLGSLHSLVKAVQIVGCRTGITILIELILHLFSKTYLVFHCSTASKHTLHSKIIPTKYGPASRQGRCITTKGNGSYYKRYNSQPSEDEVLDSNKESKKRQPFCVISSLQAEIDHWCHRLYPKLSDDKELRRSGANCWGSWQPKCGGCTSWGTCVPDMDY